MASPAGLLHIDSFLVLVDVAYSWGRSGFSDVVFIGRTNGFCPRYLGRVDVPVRYLSTARAHWRPSRIAQTTKDCPRRMSPAVKTFLSEVR